MVSRVSMLKAVLVLSVLGVAGCDVGEVPLNGDGGGGTVDADGAGAASFQAQIAPLVTACVAGTACHTIQAPFLDNYSRLAAKYKVKPGAMNILVTKGDATGGLHSGAPYFTDPEKATVAAWIDSL